MPYLRFDELTPAFRGGLVADYTKLTEAYPDRQPLIEVDDQGRPLGWRLERTGLKHTLKGVAGQALEAVLPTAGFVAGHGAIKGGSKKRALGKIALGLAGTAGSQIVQDLAVGKVSPELLESGKAFRAQHPALATFGTFVPSVALQISPKKLLKRAAKNVAAGAAGGPAGEVVAAGATAAETAHDLARAAVSAGKKQTAREVAKRLQALLTPAAKATGRAIKLRTPPALVGGGLDVGMQALENLSLPKTTAERKLNLQRALTAAVMGAPVGVNRFGMKIEKSIPHLLGRDKPAIQSTLAEALSNYAAKLKGKEPDMAAIRNLVETFPNEARVYGDKTDDELRQLYGVFEESLKTLPDKAPEIWTQFQKVKEASGKFHGDFKTRAAYGLFKDGAIADQTDLTSFLTVADKLSQKGLQGFVNEVKNEGLTTALAARGIKAEASKAAETVSEAKTSHGDVKETPEAQIADEAVRKASEVPEAPPTVMEILEGLPKIEGGTAPTIRTVQGDLYAPTLGAADDIRKASGEIFVRPDKKVAYQRADDGRWQWRAFDPETGKLTGKGPVTDPELNYTLDEASRAPESAATSRAKVLEAERAIATSKSKAKARDIGGVLDYGETPRKQRATKDVVKKEVKEGVKPEKKASKKKSAKDTNKDKPDKDKKDKKD